MFENHKRYAKKILQRRRLSHLFFIVLIAATFTSGCQAIMSSGHSSGDDGTIVRNTFPLKFKMHNFSAFCFNTIGCKVLYAGAYDERDDYDEVAPPPPADFLKNMEAHRPGIKNFPPPAIVTWRSLDGASHGARIDIGKIFKDQRVLHHVPEQDIPVETVAVAPPGPDIILIVDDRTIYVYMKATIALKKPLLSSNPLTNFVDEPILAYSHAY